MDSLIHFDTAALAASAAAVILLKSTTAGVAVMCIPFRSGNCCHFN